MPHWKFWKKELERIPDPVTGYGYEMVLKKAGILSRDYECFEDCTKFDKAEQDARPDWVPDSASEECNACSSGFSFFKRRHHCRHCGQLLCGSCSSERCQIRHMDYDKKVRVCGPCYKQLKEAAEAGTLPRAPYPDQQWLYIDKCGSIFKDPKYVIENYNKPRDCLISGKGDDAKVKCYGAAAHEDSDSSDDSDSDDGGHTIGYRRAWPTEEGHALKFKWALGNKVKIYRDRERKERIGKLKVKAKGSAKRICHWKTFRDSEGNPEQRPQWDHVASIKKMKYTLKLGEGEDAQHIKVKVKGDLKEVRYSPDEWAMREGDDTYVKWESELFTATVRRSGKVKVRIHPSSHPPALALLVAFLCTVEMAPTDLLEDVGKELPSARFKDERLDWTFPHNGVRCF
eukprot:TRINITY_DN67825_c5_g3_i1.p1 TRINITY_DN67825_c5_g3~~TRINITY_DN67825_c5_g3_i1.p1  ORF type:complete len:400 (-),score=30.35 TRINITY_DN67825_c5_g3_i1:164-1363(-)